MKRSIFDVVPEFDGRKDFIDAVMEENGKDIEKAKGNNADLQKENGDLKAKIDELKNANKELKDTVKSMSASAEDVEELKKKLEEFEEAEAKAEEKRKQEVFEKNMTERFDAVLGDAEFVNDFTRNGAYEQFKIAVADKDNKGKSDKDLFTSLTKDNDAWFKSKNEFVDISGVGKVDVSSAELDKFKKLSLIQKMEYANNHPAEYAELSKMI